MELCTVEHGNVYELPSEVNKLLDIFRHRHYPENVRRKTSNRIPKKKKMSREEALKKNKNKQHVTSCDILSPVE